MKSLPLLSPEHWTIRQKFLFLLGGCLLPFLAVFASSSLSTFRLRSDLVKRVQVANSTLTAYEVLDRTLKFQFHRNDKSHAVESDDSFGAMFAQGAFDSRRLTTRLTVAEPHPEWAEIAKRVAEWRQLSPDAKTGAIGGDLIDQICRNLIQIVSSDFEETVSERSPMTIGMFHQAATRHHQILKAWYEYHTLSRLSGNNLPSPDVRKARLDVAQAWEQAKLPLQKACRHDAALISNLGLLSPVLTTFSRDSLFEVPNGLPGHLTTSSVTERMVELALTLARLQIGELQQARTDLQWQSVLEMLFALVALGVPLAATVYVVLSMLKSLDQLMLAATKLHRREPVAEIVDQMPQDEFRTVAQSLQELSRRLDVETHLASQETVRLRSVLEEFKISKERFELVVQATHDGIWDWDLLSNQVYVSPRYRQMLGRDAVGETISFENWLADIHDADREMVQRKLQEYLNNGQEFDTELRMSNAQGDIRWFRTQARAVWDEAGQAIRMAGSMADITERRHAEEEILRYVTEVEESRDRNSEQAMLLSAQAEALRLARDQAEAAGRSKADFLANMSHEVRTPMTAILGYTDVLFDQIDSDAPNWQRRETLQVIRRNSEHLLELINDILDLSKIDAGKLSIESTEVSLFKIAEDAHSLLSGRCKEKGLFFRFEPAFPLPDRLFSDPVRIKQIAINLLSNAVKFTQAGGVTFRISVKAESMTGEVTIEVQDTGIGMSPETMRQLFQPFTQADSTMTRRFGGTGLGLAISQRLARQMGGEITVTSQLGVGTKFTARFLVELPSNMRLLSGSELVSQSLEPGQRPSKGTVSLDPKVAEAVLEGRILLAEDGIDNQKLISYLLKKAGATVSIVENGQEAISTAWEAVRCQKPFDLILMDMQMPVLDGYEAIVQLREKGYQLPIVALTAHAMSGDRERCMQSGADDYATKPIQKNKLIALCQEMIQRGRNTVSIYIPNPEEVPNIIPSENIPRDR